MMIHWNGRFGNRMFSFAFGRMYAERFGLSYLIPSEWEGTRIFHEKGAEIIRDDQLRLMLNQTIQPFDNFMSRVRSVEDYCARSGKPLSYLNPDNPADFGKRNVFYDSLCVNNPLIFREYSRKKLLKWFSWSEEVRNLDVFKRMEDAQGTYDIAHLRRDDISSPSYNKKHPQAYSVISKVSYIKAFERYGYDLQKIQWSTDDRTGKWLKFDHQPVRGGWNYPVGSHYIKDVIFDWLPDFLRLYFARTIFRSNSSFSWWAAMLSPCAKVFSPVLRERKVYLAEADEIFCDFVEGNHPHWMNLASSNCNEILIPD